MVPARSHNLCAGCWTLGLSAAGGLAEYVRVPAKTLVAVPDDSLGPLRGDRPAVCCMRSTPFGARVAPGESCVVVGVGGIGAFIVAGAHARGVADLIAIDVDDVD